MAIETLEDIVEEIADEVGAWGACKGMEGSPCGGFCRVCFTSSLTSRIREAFRVEKLLFAKESN